MLTSSLYILTFVMFYLLIVNQEEIWERNENMMYFNVFDYILYQFLFRYLNPNYTRNYSIKMLLWFFYYVDLHEYCELWLWNLSIHVNERTTNWKVDNSNDTLYACAFVSGWQRKALCWCARLFWKQNRYIYIFLTNTCLLEKLFYLYSGNIFVCFYSIF